MSYVCKEIQVDKLPEANFLYFFFFLIPCVGKNDEESTDLHITIFQTDALKQTNEFIFLFSFSSSVDSRSVKIPSKAVIKDLPFK